MEITYDNDTIIKIMTQYKRKREKEKERYDTKLKVCPEYKLKCRERSRLHYQNNKEKRKDKYESNKEYNNAKQLLSYYIKNDKLHIFKTKHADKLDLVNHLL